MHGWLQTTLAAAAAATAASVLVLLVFLRRCFSPSKQHRDLGVLDSNKERTENPQIGIAKLTPIDLHNPRYRHLDPDGRRRTNHYYVFRREVSLKPRFNWADHPSLVTDAVENGWSRFAFAASYTSSQSIRSTRSTLLGPCAAAAVVDRREFETEISWEICQGSADFMQKIRLNSGLKKINSTHSAIRAALPLPGPPLGSSSFPQEAYFEITILSSQEDGDDYDPFGNRKRSKVEGERAKLIQEDAKVRTNSESLVHVTSGNGNKKFEELRGGGGGGGGGREEGVLITVGLSRGGSLPVKLPGGYPGSIGFNSDGSVFLNGTKIIFESEKEEWGRTDAVIGCGYNPSHRKVFFTVDSQLVHVINCKSEEFGSPLYPTLAANIDTVLVVNFGQSVFKYAPANAQRTPNPCFIGPLANSPSLGYEDSRELFSMGRIDSQWLNRCATRHNNGSINNNNNNKAMDFDAESEGDLFEIVLDSCGRSPNTVFK